MIFPQRNSAIDVIIRCKTVDFPAGLPVQTIQIMIVSAEYERLFSLVNTHVRRCGYLSCGLEMPKRVSRHKGNRTHETVNSSDVKDRIPNHGRGIYGCPEIVIETQVDVVVHAVYFSAFITPVGRLSVHKGRRSRSCLAPVSPQQRRFVGKFYICISA